MDNGQFFLRRFALQRIIYRTFDLRSKVLTLGKAKINFAFPSLNRTFDFVVGTFAQQKKNKFFVLSSLNRTFAKHF